MKGREIHDDRDQGLTWNKSERQTDRYGSVYLIQNGHDSFTAEPSASLVNLAGSEGARGTLVATVLRTRKSTHIGDIFRGVFPRTPKVGARIELGTGALFYEPAIDGGVCVGVRPDDGRDADWLSIRALYDAHGQTVQLTFEKTKCG